MKILGFLIFLHQLDPKFKNEVESRFSPTILWMETVSMPSFSRKTLGKRTALSLECFPPTPALLHPPPPPGSPTWQGPSRGNKACCYWREEYVEDGVRDLWGGE